MIHLTKMNRLAEKAEAKSCRRARKKDQLADYGITTLKRLGYARTSLRDIAEASGVAVGTLHYYFEDRTDLISYCVRRYKADFITDMNSILFADVDVDKLVDHFIRGLALSIRQEAETHRLWYDIRSQAMFDPVFKKVVDSIESDLTKLVADLLKRLNIPVEQAEPLYLVLDATFRFHLQKYLCGDHNAPEKFEKQTVALLSKLV
ncbi:TetR/AcrR family transcriptional regulator [Neptunicoccus cionae]|uniref:TetR family transcriptional regulator n=1 Tax=Neptunicoccus cionae TaxID=2035344 RepID=A0A916VM63_9RHOB|nr:TetR/AcrR family transcriptional regulator [Amylibacter cionae]GGA07227.1 TetR family transcriptional regulator [Amylibacter cionae]